MTGGRVHDELATGVAGAAAERTALLRVDGVSVSAGARVAIVDCTEGMASLVSVMQLAYLYWMLLGVQTYAMTCHSVDVRTTTLAPATLCPLDELPVLPTAHACPSQANPTAD